MVVLDGLLLTSELHDDKLDDYCLLLRLAVLEDKVDILLSHLVLDLSVAFNLENLLELLIRSLGVIVLQLHVQSMRKQYILDL